MSSLETAIREKTAHVGVIGLGYVGLPLIRAFVAAGFRTMGFDVDQTQGRSTAGRARATSSTFPREWIARVRGRRGASCRRPTCGGWPRPTPC